MNLIGDLVFFGWIPLIGVLFALFSVERAVLFAIIGGWLLLPVYKYSIPGFVDYDKVSATCLAPFLFVVFLRIRDVFLLRPNFFDALMAVLCVAPFASSQANGLSIYASIAASLETSIRFCIPYLLGRLLFDSQEGRQSIAFGLVIGGLLYVPLCLFEIRMSPQLHTWLYGFYQHSFAQAVRSGGFRPTVFMQHGLVVALWLAMSTITALALYRSGRVKSILAIPCAGAVVALFVTLILCKSWGSIIIFSLVTMGLVEDRMLRSRIILSLLLALPLVYLSARVFGAWNSDWIVGQIASIEPDRAQSLEYRLYNEDLLLEANFQSRLLGSGPTDFLIVTDEDGRVFNAVPDSLWVIFYARYGLAGLFALYGLLIIPAWIRLRSIRVGGLQDPAMVIECALVLVTIIGALDCLMNTASTPLSFVIIGALAVRKASLHRP